ncbi:GDSL-type esterase/lipase family protein [Rhizobium rhizosphaerae]|uniref:SGNH/GDSL hydrolase family protein n=1 Tax=Xaviernesmea rhizosphaerae TaxID=1672749 RepID=UPI0009BD6149
MAAVPCGWSLRAIIARTKHVWAGLVHKARACLLPVLLTCLCILPEPTHAQEQRRTIMEMLFGTPRSRREAPRVYDDGLGVETRPAPQRRRPKPAAKAKPRPTPSVTVIETQPVVEKAADAKTVLVTGDFVASSLADGLTEAFAETAGLRVESRTDGSSGLVRDDHFDWLVEFPAAIQAVKPQLIIISLGANDRQMLRFGEAREKFRSEGWTAEYTRRVDRLAREAQAAKVPVLWVGMPPFPSSMMSADMVTLNALYRSAAERVGAEFVDVWDGFADEEGKFVMTGADINGQQVRLRGQEGVNFTPAGKRRLAFYLENDIRRLLGIDQGEGGGVLNEKLVPAPAGNEAILRTAPIALTDPELDGGSTLLGGLPVAVKDGKSPRDLLVEKGEMAPAPAGRVDDFRLSSPAIATTPAPAPSQPPPEADAQGDTETPAATPLDKAALRP